MPPPPPGQIWPLNQEAYGGLELRTDSALWAHVEVAGVRLGTTRSPESFLLPAGRYSIVLTSELVQDFELLVEVRAGEVAMYTEIALLPVPVRLILGPSVDGRCVVRLDDEDLDTVAALGRRLSIDRPERDHDVVLRCPGGEWSHELRAPLVEGDSL